MCSLLHIRNGTRNAGGAYDGPMTLRWRVLALLGVSPSSGVRHELAIAPVPA